MIRNNFEKRLHKFIFTEFIKADCELHIINGTANHIHVLIDFPPTRAPADIIKQVKGSSSHYINSDITIRQKFAWSKGYYLVSVSPDKYQNVFNYVRHQKQKHQNRSFSEELHQFQSQFHVEHEHNPSSF